MADENLLTERKQRAGHIEAAKADALAIAQACSETGEDQTSYTTRCLLVAILFAARFK